MKSTKDIATAILLPIGALTTGCTYSPSAAAEWEARKAVEKKLTSPGSATFEVSEIAASAEEQRLYVVYLAVDSQNGFGAVLRNHALALEMAGEELGDDSVVLHLEVLKNSPTISRVRELTREMGGTWEMEDRIEG